MPTDDETFLIPLTESECQLIAVFLTREFVNIRLDPDMQAETAELVAILRKLHPKFPAKI